MSLSRPTRASSFSSPRAMRRGARKSLSQSCFQALIRSRRGALSIPSHVSQLSELVRCHADFHVSISGVCVRCLAWVYEPTREHHHARLVSEPVRAHSERARHGHAATQGGLVLICLVLNNGNGGKASSACCMFGPVDSARKASLLRKVTHSIEVTLSKSDVGGNRHFCGHCSEFVTVRSEFVTFCSEFVTFRFPEPR